MGAQVVVSLPSIEPDGDGTRVSADVSVSGFPTVNIWYRLPVSHVSQEQAVDAFFVLARLPAMHRGATLSMPAPVSRDLLRQSVTFQDLFAQWFPGVMTPVAVEAEIRTDVPPLPDHRGLACCFTGGVDSFYSVLEPPSPLSRLVFVHGFDIPLGATRFRRRVARRLNVAARQLGIPLLEVDTNLRELTDPHCHWPFHAHGSAIASVGLLLAAEVGGILIPGHAGGHRFDRPYGSHQLTDRLHSTEYFAVDHHGAGVPRNTKTRVAVEHPVGARHLRVCFKSRDTVNCGKCPKCRRTLLDLYALRLRKRVKTFPTTPTRQELLETIEIDAPTNTLVFAQGTLDHVRAQGGPRDIERALERAIELYHVEQAVEPLMAVLETIDQDDEHDPSVRTALDRVAAAVAAPRRPWRSRRRAR